MQRKRPNNAKTTTKFRGYKRGFTPVTPSVNTRKYCTLYIFLVNKQFLCRVLLFIRTIFMSCSLNIEISIFINVHKPCLNVVILLCLSQINLICRAHDTTCRAHDILHMPKCLCRAVVPRTDRSYKLNTNVHVSK